ncbi:NAD(P)-dependent oxidoreductase [Goodfellowiella coeruleoviolacea]|uniref:D-3-phosphoglycerate dehydrogenase n=1 Tax=Goodfellowiella coeruleoviolacea TaxID=334858 RepID=A0AAE3GB79_9PSEU|nr:NAD(P)-dependent oxidoreductase [Goodfellowiella coeruleoviolacea]MCP2163874.1 D-3-phosphoglycerate dehydrogenase [Goodfellowiella coeruleoviolacea]
MSTRSPVVVVTSRSFGSGSLACEQQLTDAGLRVVRGSTTHELAELAPVLAEAVAWIAGTAPVTDAHLAAAPRLRVLARYGVGVDSVDLTAAARRGITVTNTPAANSDAVADLAIALLLAALRGVPAGDRAVRAGSWQPRRGRELGRLTLGVVGLGRIGRGVVRRAAGFGTRLLGCDPYLDPVVYEVLGVRPASLAEVAEQADAVSLHAPGGTRIVDEDWLARVRPGLIVVNTARADLVDEHAVAAALRDGRLAAYAADTLAGEAAGAGSPLLAADLSDRVVLTPHLGAQTVEAVDRMGQGAVRAVLDVLAGRRPDNVVTPQLEEAG